MNIRLKQFICCFLFVLSSRSTFSAPMAKGVVTFNHDYRLEVEIADTTPLREFGLMYREFLPENQGMLFVYPDLALRGVWMKNTLLALDILFLARDGAIVSMLRNLTPCHKDSCPVYTSVVPAQYMLEVNSGFIDKHQLQVGQKVTLDYPTPSGSEHSLQPGPLTSSGSPS